MHLPIYILAICTRER